MLFALRERMAERPVLVTFNGKSFDWPLLETRYRMSRKISMPADSTSTPRFSSPGREPLAAPPRLRAAIQNSNAMCWVGTEGGTCSQV